MRTSKIRFQKEEKLRELFWQMVAIEYHTEKKAVVTTRPNTEDVVPDGVDADEKQNEEQVILTIAFTQNSVEEISQLKGFHEEQKRLLEDLLNEEYKSLWNKEIQGISARGRVIIWILR